MKQRFFDLARKLSDHSDHPQHKLGAVIVKRNRVVSVGFNKNKTHPKSTAHYSRLHAEMCAILNAKSDVSGCDIYVYRETRDGKLGLSKPCDACQAAIEEAGINRVFYTAYNGYAVDECG